MKRAKYILTFILSIVGFVGCQYGEYDRIPSAAVRIEFGNAAMWSAYGVAAYPDHKEFSLKHGAYEDSFDLPDEDDDDDPYGDKDKDEYEKICYLCHRPESITGKMITMPQNISICPDCMQKTFDTMNNAYLALGGKVGNAFRDGLALKEK